MFRVNDFMTKNPITVSPDEKISTVIDLMKFNKIHRVPVVDEDDHLVGLITEGMITANNRATSLSIYELNYLLSKTEVRTVMVKHPVSIPEDALMEQAAQMLLKHDIGCLPVVNDKDQVTGILTQNDIFKAFLDMLGWKSKGTRIVVQVPEGVGVLEKLGHAFAQEGISLTSLVVYDLNDNDAQLLVKTKQELDEQQVIDILTAIGFTVLSVEKL